MPVTLCHLSPLSLSLSHVRCPHHLSCGLAHLQICPPAQRLSPCPSAVEDLVFLTVIIRVPGRSPVFSELPRPFSWSPFTRRDCFFFFMSLHISHSHFKFCVHHTLDLSLVSRFPCVWRLHFRARMWWSLPVGCFPGRRMLRTELALQTGAGGPCVFSSAARGTQVSLPHFIMTLSAVPPKRCPLRPRSLLRALSSYCSQLWFFSAWL